MTHESDLLRVGSDEEFKAVERRAELRRLAPPIIDAVVEACARVVEKWAEGYSEDPRTTLRIAAIMVRGCDRQAILEALK